MTMVATTSPRVRGRPDSSCDHPVLSIFVGFTLSRFNTTSVDVVMITKRLGIGFRQTEKLIQRQAAMFYPFGVSVPPQHVVVDFSVPAGVALPHLVVFFILIVFLLHGASPLCANGRPAEF
jgi:hypothetical protein